ncbi:hypothetical protein CSC94_11755 [Zhengella mangrovi]|uniref:HTH luxR-type domain-containing protein n=1 Tax=Zhengella mangrovi TaxID=1982044 RepID=A0A2G1QMN6_9HYPH|nr:LuxR C-terminal-related transcriptional regulator [Zhengella mangrovi]PHP66776.1 hypothetical protein CSC94_11755 [Zhengella mangrovi]
MIYSRIEDCHGSFTVVKGFSEAIAAVGTDRFTGCFKALVQETFQVAEFLVFHRLGDKSPPMVLLGESRDGKSAERVKSYCSNFYRLDPIFNVLNDSNPDGDYSLHLQADEINNSAYRLAFYSVPGIREQLTIANKSDGAVIAISLFAREQDGGFSAEQMAELKQFGNLLLPILSLHFRLIGNAERQKRVSAKDMEECVSWAFPELTKREVAVCARSILGVTAEGIALDLGIAQTSVLTYRRRAYARLNINSINQLSTMLIQSSAARQLAAA